MCDVVKINNLEARYPEARKKLVGFEDMKVQWRSQQSPRAKKGLDSQQVATHGSRDDDFPGPEATESSLSRNHHSHRRDCFAGGESMRVVG